MWQPTLLRASSPGLREAFALPSATSLMAGTFVVSLDFELFWGVRDQTTLDEYGPNILGVREAIPALLRAFDRHAIHATWATVGFLFFGTRSELLEHLPSMRPAYENRTLCPYRAVASIGEDEARDPYHFGRSLIERIRDTPGQEIATHTFSHYCALEPGQTVDAFREDLCAAIDVAATVDVDIRSIVFPRNQYDNAHIAVCEELGITSYRGNESAWPYRPRREDAQALWHRGARLLDAYVNASGYHTYPLDERARRGPPFNIPASRFLRPWSPRLRWMEGPRLSRIERAMTHAARHSEVFHLWWHPHNFGRYLSENLGNLERLLSHFNSLRDRYGMQSRSMREVAEFMATRSVPGISDA